VGEKFFLVCSAHIWCCSLVGSAVFDIPAYLFFCFLVCLHFYFLVCISICLCVCSSICLCICLSICLCICFSICLCVCSSICLCICLSICLCICLSICLVICLSICLCICLSICLSLVCHTAGLVSAYQFTWGATHTAFRRGGTGRSKSAEWLQEGQLPSRVSRHSSAWLYYQ